MTDGLLSVNMSDQFKKRDRVEINIRLARASDALMLASFRYLFRSSLDRARENQEDFVQRCSLWMQERLKKDICWKCWIAEQDQTLVGNLWVQLIEKIPNPAVEPEYHAYVTNFYVCDEARGRGIGSRLLATAIEWIKAQDVEAIILWPTQRSRSLYLRHGFAVRADLLELMIAGKEEQ
jgi:GNAT superfamily N-acetyltransferase